MYAYHFCLFFIILSTLLHKLVTSSRPTHPNKISLGAMYACQIYAHARDSIPGLEEQIARGEFTPLRLWLNEKIHKVGSLYANGDELMIAVTGKALDTSIFLKYLKDKYSEIYKL
jgi:carboxypeptidase Taq